VTDALVAALIEVERHVGRYGWDQPARLFALVRTAELIAAEPSLADQLTGAPDGYSSIEQEDFTPGDDLAETLAGIAWPDAAALAVANHPRKLDLRVVVGVGRDGSSHGLARVRGEDGDLLAGADLVPALAAALAHTLE